MLEGEIGRTFAGQAALNHNGVRPLSPQAAKPVSSSSESAHHDVLNVDAGDSGSKLDLLENQLGECRICGVGENRDTARSG